MQGDLGVTLSGLKSSASICGLSFIQGLQIFQRAVITRRPGFLVDSGDL